MTLIGSNNLYNKILKTSTGKIGTCNSYVYNTVDNPCFLPPPPTINVWHPEVNYLVGTIVYRPYWSEYSGISYTETDCAVVCTANHTSFYNDSTDTNIPFKTLTFGSAITTETDTNWNYLTRIILSYVPSNSGYLDWPPYGGIGKSPYRYVLTISNLTLIGDTLSCLVNANGRYNDIVVGYTPTYADSHWLIYYDDRRLTDGYEISLLAHVSRPNTVGDSYMVVSCLIDRRYIDEGYIDYLLFNQVVSDDFCRVEKVSENKLTHEATTNSDFYSMLTSYTSYYGSPLTKDYQGGYGGSIGIYPQYRDCDGTEPEWTSIVNFSTGSRCKYTVSGVWRCFESLADTNIGNQPDTSPSYWHDHGVIE